MTTPTSRAKSKENTFAAISGWPVLIGLFTYLIAVAATLITTRPAEEMIAFTVVGSIILTLLTLPGFFVVPPNVTRVLVLFGTYRGTVRKEGFYWTNPFTSKKAVSVKAHNVASDKIKVNDLLGNPIEVGAIVVWEVADTAQALFDVEGYEEYVDIQVEGAVRQVASTHPYDDDQAEGDVISLRGESDVIAEELEAELGRRLERAGIRVLEARVSHLAYAPEIAAAMLQRQQAVAVVAAREKIVEGAVSMVEQALNDLAKNKIVELDDERRATLVGNLLVVLCGQSAPQPVLNTGSLYT